MRASYQLPIDLAQQTAELVGGGVAEKVMGYVRARGVNLVAVKTDACRFWAQWLEGEGGRGEHLKVLELQVVVWLPRRGVSEAAFYGIAVTVATHGPGDFSDSMLKCHQQDLVAKLAGPRLLLPA